MQDRAGDYTAPLKICSKIRYAVQDRRWYRTILDRSKIKFAVQDGRLYRTILDCSKININKHWVSNQELHQTRNQRYK